MPIRSLPPPALGAVAALLFALPAQATTVVLPPDIFLPDFDASNFAPNASINNQYFPLRIGERKVIEGTELDDGEEIDVRSELKVLRGGPTIAGVKATTQRDRAYEDGMLVEDTFDYYAQDKLGNVWYLGEDVINYRYDDDGNFLGTDSDSAWIAGENGALPGWIMPGDPIVGLSYFNEFAEADEALDYATTISLTEVVETPIGTFSDVLKSYEVNPVEGGPGEFKYFAPGVGLIYEEAGLDENLMNPATTVAVTEIAPVPLPAALPLAVGGVGLLALAGLGGRRRARG